MVETTGEIDSQQKIDKKGKLIRLRWCLFGCLIVIFVVVICSILIPSRITDAIRWLGYNDLANGLRATEKQDAALEGGLVEMVVENAVISEFTEQPMVILKQKEGDTYLPLLIGFTEVNAIAVILEGIEMPRPLTPDLVCSIIDKMGAEVDYVVIHELKDDVFYAKIVLHANRMKLEIDSRPSDAIAIALRVKAAIYVTKSILDEAGVLPDNKPEKYDTVRLNRDYIPAYIQISCISVARPSPVD